MEAMKSDALRREGLCGPFMAAEPRRGPQRPWQALRTCPALHLEAPVTLCGLKEPAQKTSARTDNGLAPLLQLHQQKEDPTCFHSVSI